MERDGEAWRATIKRKDTSDQKSVSSSDVIVSLYTLLLVLFSSSFLVSYNFSFFSLNKSVSLVMLIGVPIKCRRQPVDWTSVYNKIPILPFLCFKRDMLLFSVSFSSW
ncbi:hypothetical protein BT69DRAFT_154849 [Atractiella rhizophila]|nr:hypothetical protein BT69DRAFT_154849 [Atractiella rhizophila]